MQRPFRSLGRVRGRKTGFQILLAISIMLGACGGSREAEPYRYTNRLIREKSPYLLQHAHNPVDWYPWGEEAIARAKREEKPIFLSIGYSTCHWCHVMERESFENEEIAALLNQTFVCIKVDREERPDLDRLYMTALQAMTGRGGWPMTLFLTPDLEPFFGGTYFPPDDRAGRPGLRTLVVQIGEAWKTDRDRILQQASLARTTLNQQVEALIGDSAGAVVEADLLDEAFRSLRQSYDPENGGFGNQPKFPTPHKLRFLMRYAKRTGNEEAIGMVRQTLDRMAMGGIHDHLAGGFHRYSTDPIWLVPHFEKMLYDQAGLALAYTDAWLLTGEPAYEAVARGILDYVLTYLTDPGGGFYSAEDADSEGIEGKFYVWTEGAIDSVLGPERGPLFREAYGIRSEGNWEGVNILNTSSIAPLLDEDRSRDRQRLLAARDRRIRPQLDDKIVTAWNGSMIEAFARAGRAFDEPRYLEAARKAARFIQDNLRQDGRLLRHYRNGPAPIGGYLDDYAYLGRGLLALYESTFDPRYLEEAIDLGREIDRLFSRPDGALNLHGSDAETLIAPVVEVYDGAFPSGSSSTAVLLLRLGHLTSDTEIEQRGWTILETFSQAVRRSPSSYVEMLSGIDFALGPITELVIAGEKDDPIVRSMWQTVDACYLPNLVRAFRPAGGGESSITRLIPYLESQGAIDGRATAYVCQDYACKLPVHDASALARELGIESVTDAPPAQ